MIITLLYLGQFAYIYSRRKHVAVQTRSPFILLVGGISLWVDSIVNFAIQLSSSNDAECVLGILTTVTNYYLGWACLALRAYRVKAVFDAYDEYLKILQTKDELGDGEDSALLTMQSQQNHSLDELR